MDPLTKLNRLPMTRDEMAERMSTTSFSKDFSFSELERLAVYMEAFRAESGDSIMEEGSREDYLCLLLDGMVGVFKYDRDSQSKQIATVYRGKTFGEMALVDDQARSASVRALRPSEFLVLTRERLDALADVYPRLALQVVMKVAQMMSDRVRRTSGQLVDLLGDEPGKKDQSSTEAR